MKLSKNLSVSLSTALLTCLCSIAPSQAASTPDPVKIGALLSLTGNWSSLGTMSETLLEMAKHDVNHYLAAHGAKRRVDLLIKDTRLEPAEALNQFQQLINQNVVAVIGPQSSAEMSYLKALADSSKKPLLSQGSTASSLAYPHDMLYRLVPDDTHESAAMTALLTARQVKAVIPIWRNDAGNNGLYQSLTKQFAATGGKVWPGKRYETDTTDFSTLVTEVEQQLGEALHEFPADSIAIYLAGFDEVVTLFDTADTHHTLKTVKWYGSDGVALSQALLNDSTARQFAIAVDYPNPIPGLSDSAQEKWQSLSNRAFAKSGQRPDAFALAAYDAFWVAALSTVFQPSVITKTQRDVIAQTANVYFGATGWTALNRAGDRRYGDYDFWALRNTAEGGTEWVNVCHYQQLSKTGGNLVCEDSK